MLLQKLTMSTVNWINSGFDGSPTFIQDPGKFFNDIAENEILQFGVEINNPELFPFGKAWMQNTAAAFNNKFQDNAQYSLNKIIKGTTPEYSATTFQQDFSQGGWNAWTAMTQSPANNPLGFKLMADNEIQKRLAGTTQSTAEAVHEALSQANGFLGDQRCSEPKGLSREEHTAGLKERSMNPNSSSYTNRICTGGWEYVTPGKMIADKATEVIGYENNAYLNVTDLNDAIAAITDALLGQFSSNIMEKGFANIGDQGSDGALVVDSTGINETYRSRTEQDFMPSQLSSSWLSVNPNFNIRTDLTQALIDEQRTYIDKLKEQNKELASTTDGGPYKLDPTSGISNAYGLIPVIDQLDYCIPGPHPGWEEDSRRILAAATDKILPETTESLKDLDLEVVADIASTVLPLAGAAAGAALVASAGGSVILGVSLGTAAGPIGMAIGALVGTLLSFFFSGGDDGQNVRAYYSVIIQGFTGYIPDYEDDNDARALNISSKGGAVQVLNSILDRYSTIMDKIYFSDPNILPSVASEAATNFKQLTGYKQMIKNNEEKISLMETTVKILGEIKSAVDALNENQDDTSYEENLKAQINTFGRLSASMVNGSDIASADNLLKQIKDKKDYIYKNLLKGPYSCEKDLEKPQNKFPAATPYSANSTFDWKNFDVSSVKRMIYPFPILYDYNVLTKGTTIPDPWTDCTVPNTPDSCKNKIPDYVEGAGNNGPDRFGPGFLSFIFFTAGGPDKQTKAERRGPERLKIEDLVPQNPGDPAENKFRSIGLWQTREGSPIIDGDARGGPFETIIGIY